MHANLITQMIYYYILKNLDIYRNECSCDRINIKEKKMELKYYALREWIYNHYKRISFILMEIEHYLLLSCSTNKYLIKQLLLSTIQYSRSHIIISTIGNEITFQFYAILFYNAML